ncbi:MAG: hypothetical protein LQ339_002083 [Xanthoria mediterranea]|nr:MAG: hypothetical protein LQ339_002083 [Xanthoria mediterranea]
MNSIIQSQLDRVDNALNALIASIESYNPSVPAAIDLLAADDELQRGVKLLAQHQANHSRILRLRSEIEAQEQQTKSTLALLAETREELLSTPATTFPEHSRNVPFTELLEYAKNISRYTVPPTFREPLPQPTAADAPPKVETATAIANGAGDPTAEAREANGIANGIANGANLQNGEKKEKGVGLSSLTPDEVLWLNELARTEFVPWPNEEVIKRGALGQIQVMLEQGVDPESGGAAEEVARKIEADETEKNAQTGEGAMEDVLEAGQRDEEASERRIEQPRREEKPKVFKGLDLDEDSDED